VHPANEPRPLDEVKRMDQPPPREPSDRFMRGVRAALIFVALVLVAISITASQTPLSVGSAVPGVNAVDVDGQPYDVGALVRGKPLVVNIWATWCRPCLDELPAFAAEARRLEGRVQFVGFAVDSKAPDVKALVDRFGLPYPNVLVDGATQRAWGADAVPSTYLVDEKGVVRWSIKGAVDPPLLREKVREALGIDAPPKG